jgi:hypothetical protein
MTATPEQFEKLILSPALAKDWYGHTLVGGTQAGPMYAPETAPDAAPRKETLVFVKPMPDADRAAGMQFLTDILKACRLTMSDIALFEGPGPGELDTLRTQCDPRTIILFGISPAQTGLPLHFPSFQVQEYDGMLLLSAPEISALREDKALKSRLWLSLKQIFSL